MIEKERDFHIHATYYKAGNRRSDMTVENVLEYCMRQNLDIIGIGEHMDQTVIHPDSCIRELIDEYRSLKPPIESFVFAEASIIDREGAVTCSAETKRDFGLDYLLGGFHFNKWHSEGKDIFAYIEEEYYRILNMVKHSPQIDVVAHPWRAGVKWEQNGSIPRWSFELVPEHYQDRLIDEALNHGKGIEINLKNTTVDESYIRFVRKIKDSGVPMSIGSDAHNKDAVGFSLEITAFLNDLGVKDKDLWMP